MSKLNVIYHYFPRFRRQVFDALADRGEPVHFVYGRNSRFGVAALARDGDELRRNLFVGNLIFQSFGWSTLRKLTRDDSIVLGDLKFINSWVYAALARLWGRKLLFWTHGVLEPEVGLKWLIRKAYYNLAHGLLLYSEHEAQLMRDLGWTKPIHVVGNSNFDENDIRQLDGISDTPAADGICYIGRISEQKGLAEFRRFAVSHPETRVVLVGPVAEGERVDTTAPPNLVLLSPEYELAGLQKATEGCDTLVMFSPAGLSLFTAMALGKRPVVKSSHPQKPEFHIVGAYGVIEQFSDYEGLVNAIRHDDATRTEFLQARELFLAENSAREVADRVWKAVRETREARVERTA